LDVAGDTKDYFRVISLTVIARHEAPPALESLDHARID
jgi:hypothetical protein